MRLTNKQIVKELKQNIEVTITTTENVSRDIYLKFAEFEDFMEEQGFEDLEHLKLRLGNLSYGSKYYVMWQKLKDIIKKDIKHNTKEFNQSYIYAFEHYSTAENWVLDRMQELEKE